MNKHHHIYGLFFTVDEQDIVFYVGHSNNLERRREEHLTNAVNPNHAEYLTEKYRWCRSLREQGIDYDLKPLQLWVSTDEASEYAWILRQARENIEHGITFYDGMPLCNMKAGDFLDEMLADRSITTAKDVKEFKNKRLQIERERRSYLRDFSGTAEPTAQAQKIIDWFKKDSEQRQQKAEDAAKKRMAREGKYNAMLSDPERQERIRIETERMMNGNKKEN